MYDLLLVIVFALNIFLPGFPKPRFAEFRIASEKPTFRYLSNVDECIGDNALIRNEETRGPAY